LTVNFILTTIRYMTDYPTSVRISPQTREALQRRAEADGRSLTNYIARVLEQHVENTPEPKKAKSRKS
jgi:predicted DNA-binding protein